MRGTGKRGAQTYLCTAERRAGTRNDADALFRELA